MSRRTMWRALRREPLYFQVGVWLFAIGLAGQTVLGIYILHTL